MPTVYCRDARVLIWGTKWVEHPNIKKALSKVPPQNPFATMSRCAPSCVLTQAMLQPVSSERQAPLSRSLETGCCYLTTGRCVKVGGERSLKSFVLSMDNLPWGRIKHVEPWTTTSTVHRWGPTISKWDSIHKGSFVKGCSSMGNDSEPAGHTFLSG